MSFIRYMFRIPMRNNLNVRRQRSIAIGPIKGRNKIPMSLEREIDLTQNPDTAQIGIK